MAYTLKTVHIPPRDDLAEVCCVKRAHVSDCSRLGLSCVCVVYLHFETKWGGLSEWEEGKKKKGRTVRVTLTLKDSGL